MGDRLRGRRAEPATLHVGHGGQVAQRPDAGQVGAQVLVHLDGAWQPDRREAHAARLLLGETASSEILFRWVAEAVRTLALPPDAVGPIVTLGWLHHGLSPVARDEASRTLAPGLRSDGTFAEWMARVWLSTPGLGTGWSSWRR